MGFPLVARGNVFSGDLPRRPAVSYRGLIERGLSVDKLHLVRPPTLPRTRQTRTPSLDDELIVTLDNALPSKGLRVPLPKGLPDALRLAGGGVYLRRVFSLNGWAPLDTQRHLVPATEIFLVTKSPHPAKQRTDPLDHRRIALALHYHELAKGNEALYLTRFGTRSAASQTTPRRKKKPDQKPTDTPTLLQAFGLLQKKDSGSSASNDAVATPPTVLQIARANAWRHTTTVNLDPQTWQIMNLIEHHDYVPSAEPAGVARRLADDWQPALLWHDPDDRDWIVGHVCVSTDAKLARLIAPLSLFHTTTVDLVDHHFRQLGGDF